jgi:shikimate dehydrogenase
MIQSIGLIGYPLKHSVSPDFQQAALNYYKLDVRYETWETKAENLTPVINQLRRPQDLGANITVPYKETILHLIDTVDDFANLVGAVNTVVNRDGKLVGFNTDSYGFLKALHEDAKFEPQNKRVIVLGAGGAARAVSFALLKEKASALAISNRNTERAKSLVRSLVGYASGSKLKTEVVALPWQSSELQKTIQNCQLIVNCTTLGMKWSPHEEQSPLVTDFVPKDALVYDLVYNPSETPLLRMAREAGATTIGGLPMLVYQGAASFELWTGREAPLDIMFLAAQKALMRIGG